MAIGCRYLVKKIEVIFHYLLDRNFLMGDPDPTGYDLDLPGAALTRLDGADSGSIRMRPN